MNKIEIIHGNYTPRTFGWIQDPSNFRSLCDVVAVFDCNSKKYKELSGSVIPQLVSEEDGRKELINALNKRPLAIAYSKLVGTSFFPRASARCNGIIQAAVKGQSRPFIGDWPADNFLRWAHALGFIRYDYESDSFSITPEGKRLSKAYAGNSDLNDKEKAVLIDAVLAYPPACRILNLLAHTDDTHLTKFELGSRLGFVGEDGFTSLGQKTIVKAIALAKDAYERNNIIQNREASADKYARMIAKWLQKLGLVEQKPKKVAVDLAGETFSCSIPQAYVITNAGRIALGRVNGRSRHKRIAKNVFYEMMATKGSDREYIRTRRSYILKFLTRGSDKISYSSIVQRLSCEKLNETIQTVKDDIIGLCNIGLSIQIYEDGCKWSDRINDFVVPQPPDANFKKSQLTGIKEQIRAHLANVSHDYLTLIDLAYDSRQNALFEVKAVELLTEECNFCGQHMGGSRKPDGIIFTDSLDKNFGVIIDTKAYKDGYNLPISQADEMSRYIDENKKRSDVINPSQWWKKFGDDIDLFFFMFVSGHFIGNFAEQIKRISNVTGIDGTAIGIQNLLLVAEAIKSGRLSKCCLRDKAFNSSEFIPLQLQ